MKMIYICKETNFRGNRLLLRQIRKGISEKTIHGYFIISVTVKCPQRRPLTDVLQTIIRTYTAFQANALTVVYIFLLCFIALFQLFMFYLLMKILSSKLQYYSLYRVKIVQIYTQQSGR